MKNSDQSFDEYKRRICLAINYIVEHIDENPSLDDIAEASFFSKYHFHRIFTAVVGETVAQFVRRIRLERAANVLIHDSSLDITTAAHMLGFSSSQNFAKAFTKHFGMPPSEFRKQNSKNGNTLSKNGDATFSDPLYVQHISSTDTGGCKMNVQVKEMPEYHVCYVRQIGPYGPEVCGSANRRLMQWAGPRGLIESGLVIGIAWDNPEITPPEKCRYDACLTVPVGTEVDGEIGLQNLPGGMYAVYRCSVNMDGFAQAWGDLFSKWLPGSGYQPDDRPCFEICRSTPQENPDNKWVVDICCSVRPL